MSDLTIRTAERIEPLTAETAEGAQELQRRASAPAPASPLEDSPWTPNVPVAVRLGTPR